MTALAGEIALTSPRFEEAAFLAETGVDEITEGITKLGLGEEAGSQALESAGKDVTDVVGLEGLMQAAGIRVRSGSNVDSLSASSARNNRWRRRILAGSLTGVLAAGALAHRPDVAVAATANTSATPNVTPSKIMYGIQGLFFNLFGPQGRMYIQGEFLEAKRLDLDGICHTSQSTKSINETATKLTSVSCARYVSGPKTGQYVVTVEHRNQMATTAQVHVNYSQGEVNLGDEAAESAKVRSYGNAYKIRSNWKDSHIYYRRPSNPIKGQPQLRELEVRKGPRSKRFKRFWYNS